MVFTFVFFIIFIMQNEQNTGESKNIFWVDVTYDTGCKKCLLLKIQNIAIVEYFL